ncbi:MAG TPA: 3-phosphoshikimate 1-carboxyvinyltransferase [Caulobacteraceae bacterium]|nr:3-phosphoshikimate 1-carboxyvinyltransferase [Caulobacteraceae bacterium]
MAETVLRTRPGRPLRGVAAVPGDKSISHRALIMGALATGETTILGLLGSADVLATARAAADFGAEVRRADEGVWRVRGRGAFAEPERVIDCGNSGTGVRLLMGAAAGFSIAAGFDGDGSLRRRPMLRVLEPLGRMGAQWIARAGGRLPAMIKGGDLKGIDYALPQPSAQVKSALLLAGLNARGTTTVKETAPSRDHTERLLPAFGARVTVSDSGCGRAVRLEGGQSLAGARIEVPADPSSAAFPVVAALVTPGSEILVRGVLLNPLRWGLFETLAEMGAKLAVENRRPCGGEEIGDVVVSHSELNGVVVPSQRAPSMIDEYPALAVAAAFARGPTVMQGLGELRFKESDRLAAILALLRACGAKAEEDADTLTVSGGDGEVAGGARIATAGDHRIAMAGAVLGLAAGAPVEVDEPAMIATSFPGFVDLVRDLGGDIALL